MHNTRWSRISHPAAVVVDGLESRRGIYSCKYYACTEVYANKAHKCKVAKNALKGRLSIMASVFFPLLIKNELSRPSTEKIALKVQLSVIQLSRSQSISYLNSNCIEVLKIKELYFYSIYILKSTRLSSITSGSN